jgi:ribonuclease J
LLEQKRQENIKVFALGGVGEVGKNMYVVEVNDDMIVIDAGLMFPEEGMFGIDKVIPDITYLVENKDRLRGIFLTHGHEEHIGAVAYVLKQIRVPVYGTKLTLALVDQKLKEQKIERKAPLIGINCNSNIMAGETEVTFFNTQHSIPGSVGVCIHTSKGAIVHTGDFKFDYSNANGLNSDIQKMAEIGSKGVLCLMSNSMNAERLGYTGSEKAVGEKLSDAFYSAEGRIIIAAVATNIKRLQQIFDAAIKNKRKIVVVGESMENMISIASNFDYLTIQEDVLIDINQMNDLPSNEVAILTTGSQGEPMSELTLMAKDDHKLISIEKNDTVIIPSTPNPGKETFVSKTIDLLYRAGANVIHGKQGVYVSGHGYQEELKLMITLMKPKYLLPIHGEFRMQKAHAKLGIEVGIHPHHIFLLEKGDVIEMNNGMARKGGKVPAGNVLIDGLGVGDIGNIVLRDRRLLSQDGVLIVVVTLNKRKSMIISGPEILSRGFVYVRESEKLLDEATEVVSTILKRCIEDNVNEWSPLKATIRDTLNQFFYEKTRRRPMIMPIIMEV